MPVKELIAASTRPAARPTTQRAIMISTLAPVAPRVWAKCLAAFSSCGPVRAALLELESDGVLDVFPHRGAVIRGVDARFIRNLLELRAAISLGRLWADRGNADGAYGVVSEVHGWFTEGFETADFREATSLLEALERDEESA